MNLPTAEILDELRRRGVTVTVEGDTICLEPKRALDDALRARIRAAKPAILEALRTVPFAWPSTHVTRAPFEIVKDEFRAAPVRLSNHETVTDTFKLAMSTFAQLCRKLANPNAPVGWEVSQLLARLKAVGLTVVIDEEVLKALPPATPVEQ
jgi:hypothetical protein